MFPICWKIPVTGMKIKIKTAAASVVGPLHANKNLPCQDFYKICSRGKNFVAVVSDGAGSAKYGKTGARIVCETLVDMLKNVAWADVRTAVASAIASARKKLTFHRLNKSKSEAGLNDFAATVVGMVYRGRQGCFFHIGDGAALAYHDEDIASFVASPPENGSFSCETFFYTQDCWAKNLRFTPLEKINTVFLMTDGVTNFSFSEDYRKIEKGFILPIDNFLKEEKNKQKAERALSNTLNTQQARKLNSDDKTLLWVKL